MINYFNESERVTVVIPSYNRFNYLINAVKSVKPDI